MLLRWGAKMNELINKEWKLHSHGLVRVVDMMGSDAAIVQMARTSYGEGTKTVNEDKGLIRYLMRHRHTSPFEGCVLKLHLKMPIFIARQWVRHRTASMNEYSARYSEMRDEFYVPETGYVQLQSKTNKQGSEGQLDTDTVDQFVFSTQEEATESYNVYKSFLDNGVAREMARINLPLTVYTEMYWQMNLHNLLHFCSLRSDPHAQREIRDYSDIILHEVIKQWCPLTYEAFMDYVMNADTFSAQEMTILKRKLNPNDDKTIYEMDEFNSLSKREQDEFLKKIGRPV